MAKKYIRQLGSTIFILFAVCILLIIGGCSDVKSIGFVPGTWSAENIQVGESEIGKITLTITETYEEGDGYLVFDNDKYGCYVNISGEDAEVTDAATWVSKYEREISFIWKDNDFSFFIETKQDSDGIFIQASLQLWENSKATDGVSFTMH